MTDMDYYERLGLPQNATLQEIKSQYWKLAQIFHPDKTNGDKIAEESFKLIKEAYECLSDSTKRLEYDEKVIVKSNLCNRQTAPPIANVGTSTNSFWQKAAAFGIITLALGALFSDGPKPRRRLKSRKKIATRKYKRY